MARARKFFFKARRRIWVSAVSDSPYPRAIGSSTRSSRPAFLMSAVRVASISSDSARTASGALADLAASTIFGQLVSSAA